MAVLLEHEVINLLSRYGIQSPAHRFAEDVHEAVTAAEELSYPVVMKVVSPDILHKSDVGGVRTGLKNASEVHQAYFEMIQQIERDQPLAQIKGVILYQQAPDGLEVIVGITQDSTFGPVLMFGLGGVFVEALQDVTFRAIPIQKFDALQMISGIKNRAVLSGWRGQKAVDIECLADLLCKVSLIACDHPEIKEMDLNPVRIVGQEMWVLDAKTILKD